MSLLLRRGAAGHAASTNCGIKWYSMWFKTGQFLVSVHVYENKGGNQRGQRMWGHTLK